MTSDGYMNFEEASSYLNVSRSTLYRWLREGKVPAHKLGRQWRFLREELERWSREDGDERTIEWLSELDAQLRARLDGRVRGQDNNERSEAMVEQVVELDGVKQELQAWFGELAMAERLVWDAVDHRAQVIHLEPAGESYQIRYRGADGLQRLTTIAAEAFGQLDGQWRRASEAVRGDEHRRRMFLERSLPEPPDADAEGAARPVERLQLRYQRLETLAGPRISLRLLPSEQHVRALEDIVPQAEQLQMLRRWSRAPHGLVLLAGRSGSGKTTTAYVCLQELAALGDRVIFTIEETTGTFLPGINQVEADLDDARAYRECFSAIFRSDLDVLFLSSTIAQRHRALLWGTALSAAEGGHLVLVQMEAESAEDALAQFQQALDRSIDDHLVGACWQELLEKEQGGRRARYEMIPGPLDVQGQ